MVVPIFPVVSETFILYQITGLLDLGHDVKIISLGRPKEQPVHHAVQEYQLLERTTYLQYPASKLHRAVQGACSLFRLLARYGPKACEAIRMTPKEWGLPRPTSLLAADQLLAVLSDPDIIHCHFGPTGSTILPAKILLDTPMVTTFHGVDASEFVQQHGDDVYDDLFRHGDLFTAVSDFLRRKIEAIGCPSDKTVIQYVTTPVTDIPFQVTTRKNGDPTRIFTIARLVEKKGVEYSIEAVSRLVSAGYNVTYDIAGDGPLHHELQEQIESSGMQRYVHLLGRCNRTEICKLLGRAHIFVLASVTSARGDTEGMPVVLREAQAAGLPTITTNHAGNPEAIIDGESGFVVPERDVDALADRLEYLIDNPQIWPEMGRHGRQFVEEEFDIKKLNRQLISIYEDVIAGRRPTTNP